MASWYNERRPMLLVFVVDNIQEMHLNKAVSLVNKKVIDPSDASLGRINSIEGFITHICTKESTLDRKRQCSKGPDA